MSNKQRTTSQKPRVTARDAVIKYFSRRKTPATKDEAIEGTMKILNKAEVMATESTIQRALYHFSNVGTLEKTEKKGKVAFAPVA